MSDGEGDNDEGYIGNDHDNVYDSVSALVYHQVTEMVKFQKPFWRVIYD